MHVVCQMDLTAGDHGDLMPGTGQIQAHIPSGICAADDYHPVTQLLLMTEYRLRQPGMLCTGNRRIDRLGAGSTENGVIALCLQQLRCGGGTGEDGHLRLVQLPEQIGKIFPNGPLIIRHTGSHQLSAQHRRGLIQRDRMTAASRSQRRHQSAGAAAYNRNLFGRRFRGKQIPLPSQPGIDRAGVMPVTAVAENAGDNVGCRRTGLKLFIIVVVRQELTCHGEQVGFSFLQKPLHHLRIAIAAYGSAGNADPARLEGGGVVDGGGVSLFVVQTVDMGGGAVHAADLDDIHIALQRLTEVQKILKGIARRLLLGGNLRLNQKVLAADGLDSGEDLLCKGGTFCHGLAAIFVRSLV